MIKVIKEEIEIEKIIDQYMYSIVEYDSIVNQYFLLMIKQKIENPTKKLQKELKNQELNIMKLKEKLER